MRRVTVALAEPYDVVAGRGALAALAGLVADRRKVAVVSQARVWDLQGEALAGALGRGDDPWVVTMGDGEGAKCLATVESLCRTFASGGLLRGDLVIAFGGGVVGDTAGFAAAVYHRGVAVVQVPTTLLAQVDAAIGGKTAVNVPEGKNLIGAFHQPRGVVADARVLSTLPDVEFRCGLGEVAKYALMPQGGGLLDWLRLHAGEALARDDEALGEMVARCAAIKAEIVAVDPEERSGLRAALNYGHTLAHALETTGGYTLAHGEAVAVGLVFAANLALALNRVSLEVVDRVYGVVAALGLRTAVSHDAGFPRAQDLVGLMRRDKKARGGLSFVLPGPDGLELVEDPPQGAIESALHAVGVEG